MTKLFHPLTFFFFLRSQQLSVQPSSWKSQKDDFFLFLPACLSVGVFRRDSPRRHSYLSSLSDTSDGDQEADLVSWRLDWYWPARQFLNEYKRRTSKNTFYSLNTWIRITRWCFYCHSIAAGCFCLAKRGWKCLLLAEKHKRAYTSYALTDILMHRK